VLVQDEKRDRFKLILNCIMIITSVIPPGEISSLYNSKAS